MAKISTKEKIRKAAQQVFASRGLLGASVKEIADVAQVNKAMIFYYYQSKENLYYSVIKEEVRAMRQMLDDALEGKTGAVSKLKTLLELNTEVCFGPGRVDLMKIIMQDAMGPSDELRDMVMDDINAIRSTICGVICEGVAEGVFKKVDPLLTSIALMSFMNAVMHEKMFTGNKIDRETLNVFLKTLFMEGITL